jgi:hypothetical protein
VACMWLQLKQYESAEAALGQAQQKGDGSADTNRLRALALSCLGNSLAEEGNNRYGRPTCPNGPPFPGESPQGGGPKGQGLRKPRHDSLSE